MGILFSSTGNRTSIPMVVTTCQLIYSTDTPTRQTTAAAGPLSHPLPKGTTMNWNRTVETVKQLVVGEEQ